MVCAGLPYLFSTPSTPFSTQAVVVLKIALKPSSGKPKLSSDKLNSHAGEKRHSRFHTKSVSAGALCLVADQCRFDCGMLNSSHSNFSITLAENTNVFVFMFRESKYMFVHL